MNLNTEQKEAVEYLDGPLLVLAGPGTGKTQLLSEKVAYILKETDTNPENILCLTFTESGASNMRERLKTIVGRDGAKVYVSTYHSFGQEILGQYKNYSEEFTRQLDTAIDEVTQYKIVKALQDALPGNDILRGDSVKDIISVISEAKSAGLSADDLLKIAEQNIEDSEVLSKTISPFLENVVARNYQKSLELAYLPIGSILGSHINDKPLLKSIERIITVLARSLQEALEKAENLKSITPLTEWRNKNFEIDKNGDYCLKDRVSNRKLLSLSHLMKQYNQYLFDNKMFDFDDMIEEAVKVLKTDDGFRMTLQERYQFIMLDEFQDTNPSQFAIVKQLTDYEKPLIMAVGDDDQAIYEFQGALASNLTDFKKHFNAKVITLVQNYRSTQEILDFSHHIISQAIDRFADKELVANKKSPKMSQIFRYEFNSSDMEFGFIADEVARLIEEGVKQDQIAIISYKSKYFEPLLPYLKSHRDIKIAYEKRDNLFEDERIHELLVMSRYVYELASEQKPSAQIMEILAFPFFELPILEVVKLINQAKKAHISAFEYLSENGSEKIQSVMQFLADLVAKSFTEPLEIMLDYMIGTAELNGFRSPFLNYYSAYGSSETEVDRRAYATFLLYENLASLRGKLKKHFGDKALKLKDLVEMVSDYEAADMPLNTTSPYRDADEAVQILTAHKAKGLEFEYVFIIAADHTAWGSGKGNNNFLTLPKNLTQIRHTGMTDSERLRVLYVALTRAKNTLYITNSLHDFNGKSAERLEYLDEKVEKTDEGEIVTSPYLPSSRVISFGADVPYDIRENNLRNWLAPYLVESPDMRAFYKTKMANLKMSASALTSFVDIIYNGPQVFFERYVLNAPSEPSTWSMTLGNLIHETFEQVTKTNISNEEATDYYLSAVEKCDLREEDKKLLREKGRESLIMSLNRFGDIIRNGQAEVDFYGESLVVDGVPITGKIDHLVIDEINKTIEVYDFKTGGYHDNGWKAHPGLYSYMLQLIFYKILLNNSIKYRNYKITKGHILFVMKDKADDEVHEREYIYNADDEAEFKKLLTAVYKQITELSYLDDKELFVAPDKGRCMKDIRNFIELLLARTT